jgi:hypothetical protein
MKKMFSFRSKGITHSRLLGMLLVGLALGTIAVSAQSGKQASGKETAGWTVGRPQVGERGIQKTTAAIMADPAARKPREHIYLKREFKVPGRENRPQDPNALPLSQLPPPESSKKTAAPAAAQAPQPVSTNFNAATGPDETGSFPPDTMGAVGPAQFVLAVNGLIRTFTKAGVADGVLNVNTDVFFASILTPETPPGLNFTTDPQIRYDRLSARWFITMVDVPSSDSNHIGDTPNRILIAVSDAASAGVITGSTVWTYYFVQQNTVGGGNTLEFCDYPSLGVDNNALYVGGDMFVASSGAFNGTTGFAIRKSSVLSGGPAVVTAFRSLTTGTTEGPYEPRGVDNYDPAANEGYFIGPSILVFGRLDIRRVTDPGGTPGISANILLTVPATSAAILVDHLGNTGGTNGRLDGLDDNIFAAHIRNGRLWTAQGIAVTSAGVASTTNTQRRNAVRWYELNGIRSIDNGGTPVVVQSGTVFNNATTVATARQYWIPTVMVSGQGHAAFGYSTAGTPFHADAATNGRLVGDTLGTSGAVAMYTASGTAYNPAGDTGGTGGRRWGDYSFTCLDPLDDMTFWTIQEYCNGTNTYGCQVAKLLAPPPATPASASSSVAAGQASASVTITGTASSGSGFYDPGANLAPPAVSFAHVSASVTGGVVVNSVTYTDPTHVILNLNTTGASVGAQNVTITNPDGQSLTGTGILTITAGPMQLTGAVSRKVHGGAGSFDVDLPLAGEPGVECRSSGGTHTLVFTFTNNVASGNATVTAGTGTAGSPTFSANTMTVDLTGVTNAQKVTVTLSGVTDVFSQVLADTNVSMNVLIGDTNSNKTVNSSDVSQTKSRIAVAVDSTTFRSDVNVNGAINATDIGLIKLNLGTSVP